MQQMMMMMTMTSTMMMIMTTTTTTTTMELGRLQRRRSVWQIKTTYCGPIVGRAIHSDQSVYTMNYASPWVVNLPLSGHAVFADESSITEY
jgi:hypothetical protein